MNSSCFCPDARRPLTGPLCHLDQGWGTFLRARTQIIYKFWRKSFACSWEFWTAK